MMENEAINALKLEGGLQIDGKAKRVAQFFEGLSVAIQALEEVQAYRAIGTVEEFKAFKLGRLGNKGFITIGQTMEEYAQEIREMAVAELEEAKSKAKPWDEGGIGLAIEIVRNGGVK